MDILFMLISTIAWGIAEIFYKKGNIENEKYSHLKTTVFVGIFFGIYATVITIIQSVQDINFLKYIPLNMLIYLPVALCYLVSMTCSYFGVRFIQESISDPIENTSGAFVFILCMIFAKFVPTFEMYDSKHLPWIIVAVVVIVVGLICISVFDKNGKEDRHKKYGKKLAVLAIAMPFCYMMLDATGTFLDYYYTESIDNTLLKGVSDATLEHMANTCYEFIFFIVAMGILVFLKIKGEKLFSLGKATDENGNLLETEGLKWYQKVNLQRDKLLAALFETIGQSTYIFVLSEGGGVAAVILGAGTVIISVLLSRIVLKEKLTWIQYIFIFIILAGIIFLSIAEA